MKGVFQTFKRLWAVQFRSKCILELDLVAYSDVALLLEEHLNEFAVQAFEKQIQHFIDDALTSTGLNRKRTVLRTAGDSAVLIFDEPETMHNFSAGVSRITAEYNRDKSHDAARRWFRLGCATGNVIVDRNRKEISGTAMVRAARLEAAAGGGSLLVDTATFKGLPRDIAARYGTELVVTGKRDERFAARRCSFVNPRALGNVATVLASMDGAVNRYWGLLDDGLKDAFAIAYNTKRRTSSIRPTRISTKDLFRALALLQDKSLNSFLATIPQDAMPPEADTAVTNEPRLLGEEHCVSDCIAESLEGLLGQNVSSHSVSGKDPYIPGRSFESSPSLSDLDPLETFGSLASSDADSAPDDSEETAPVDADPLSRIPVRRLKPTDFLSISRATDTDPRLNYCAKMELGRQNLSLESANSVFMLSA